MALHRRRVTAHRLIRAPLGVALLCFVVMLIEQGSRRYDMLPKLERTFSCGQSLARKRCGREGMRQAMFLKHQRGGKVMLEGEFCIWL